jgi:hypothetical protein
MQPPSQRIVTCLTCGAALEETFGGEGRCMFCLLQAGIGGEQEVTQDSTPNVFEGGVRFGIYEIDCHADEWALLIAPPTHHFSAKSP